MMMDEEISVIDGDEGKLLDELVQFLWGGVFGVLLTKFCPILGFVRALPSGGLKYEHYLYYFSCISCSFNFGSHSPGNPTARPSVLASRLCSDS